jgi:cytochrome c biogenesis protein CcmG/thiol:disulfide interchange protein DsbE
MAGRAKVVAQGLALAGVVALLGLLVWKIAFEDTGGVAAQLDRGETPVAPLFVLERLDREGTLSLAELRGKAVVLNFWASWCIPCKDEAPLLEEAWQEHRDRGLVVLGVDAQDFKGDARKFMARYGLTYPVVHDGKGSTLGRYGITGFPETFFVDRQGNLVGERLVGGLDLERNRDKFQQGIELALGGAGADGSGSAP